MLHIRSSGVQRAKDIHLEIKLANQHITTVNETKRHGNTYAQLIVLLRASIAS